MADKKAASGASGLMSGRIVAGAIAVAIISALSSFVAIRFALPKQIVVIQKNVVETPSPTQNELQGDLWSFSDPFIVNLADPSHHFLKVSVSLMIARPGSASGQGKTNQDSGTAAKALASRMTPIVPVFRDAVIGVLRRQTISTLYDQDRVKSEIKVALNLLHEQDADQFPRTLSVYFSDFVIQ